MKTYVQYFAAVFLFAFTLTGCCVAEFFSEKESVCFYFSDFSCVNKNNEDDKKSGKRFFQFSGSDNTRFTVCMEDFTSENTALINQSSENLINGKLTSFVSCSKNKIWFSVPKMLPFAVLSGSSPYLENLEECKGAIYPYTTELKNEDAFAADILLSLYASSSYAGGSESDCMKVREYLACFNWQRFIEECRNVNENYRLDKEYIMQKIAAGSFTKKDLKYTVENKIN